MMKNIDLSSLILNNELEWMESIGCKKKKGINIYSLVIHIIIQLILIL